MNPKEQKEDRTEQRKAGSVELHECGVNPTKMADSGWIPSMGEVGRSRSVATFLENRTEEEVVVEEEELQTGMD